MQPPRSPDVNACDIWLWSAMREWLSRREKPKNVQDLKVLLWQAFLDVARTPAGEETIRRVTNDFVRRVRLLANGDGGLIEVD